MARAALVILMCLLVPALGAVYTVQAGAVSEDGQWLFFGLYPIAGLSPPFAVQVGDSIEFVCGGSAKAIVFTDRPYIALVDRTGLLDGSLVASGPSPLALISPNVTHSSGVLYPGDTFTFTFPAEDTWHIFDPISSLRLGQVSVQAAPAPYTPAEVSAFITDQIDRDEALASGSLLAATDVDDAPVGEIRLSWSTNATGTAYSLLRVQASLADPPADSNSNFYPPTQRPSLLVYKNEAVTFVNRDLRLWNVFVNATGVFAPDSTYGGGALFLLPSASAVLTHSRTAYASSGVLAPGAGWRCLFRNTGTYHFTSTLTGLSGVIRVVNPPGTATSVGRVFATIFIVIAYAPVAR